jgi:hypothetical protein
VNVILHLRLSGARKSAENEDPQEQKLKNTKRKQEFNENGSEVKKRKYTKKVVDPNAPPKPKRHYTKRKPKNPTKLFVLKFKF